MISMAKKMIIKEMYEEGLSKNEIKRRTNLNYRTVCKYAEQTDWNDEKLPNVDPENYPVLGKYIPRINEWLENDKRVPRKQRHTAKRIYNRLREEEGFTGGYSSVKRYVRKKRTLMKTGGTGYLPIDHPMAYAQVDFGEFIYYDPEGLEHKAYELAMTFPYSNKGFSQVFPSQNQECLLEGMRRIFEYIGGVPVRIRFDNMSTAVAQVLEGTERKLTDGFARFKLHYRFQADFCNPASGNEKGNVENKVGYIRRNALVPVPTIADFDEFNEYLWTWCEKDADRDHYEKGVLIRTLWEEEKPKLLILPEVPFNVFRYEAVKVTKTGFATLDTNKYGLSPEYNGKTVMAKIFFDKIEFYFDHSLLAVYSRCYEKRQTFMDWTQYIRTLCRKPGAVEHTRFFTFMPLSWQTYLLHTSGSERRNALQLLEDIVNDGNADHCTEVLDLAQRSGRTDAESVRQCYYSMLKQGHSPEPLSLCSDVPILGYDPDLSVYDGLTGGDANA